MIAGDGKYDIGTATKLCTTLYRRMISARCRRDCNRGHCRKEHQNRFPLKVPWGIHLEPIYMYRTTYQLVYATECDVKLIRRWFDVICLLGNVKARRLIRVEYARVFSLVFLLML